MQAVENGTRITSVTTQAMQAVVEGSQRINSIIEEIALATDMQAAAVDQVAQGVDQISCVVQTNSATAEQSAAASEELSGQAQIMKGLVQGFRLYEGEHAEETSRSAAKQKTSSSSAKKPVYTEHREDPVLTIDPVYFEGSSTFGGGKY